MTPDFGRSIDAIWVLVAIYWVIGALRVKRAARRERRTSRVVHLAIILTAGVLMFSDRAGVGVLGARFVPRSDAVGWAGLCLTATGCAFAVWARARLGANWSGTVTRKDGHELIRGGPYAIVRHPIYAGFLLGLLGTALELGEARGLLALALAFVAWYRKLRLEERFLIEQFGDDYLRYRREVKRLVPFVY